MLAAGARSPDVHGRGWSLADARTAGPVLLVFFKISCPTCQFTLPFLTRFAGSALQVVLVSQDDLAATEAFLVQFGLRSLPVVFDPPWDFPAGTAYRITHVPSLFLIEPDGVISRSVEGFHKVEIEGFGERFGVIPFLAGEAVPALRPG